ncbi:SGNH/GDSL hydrolase family protein [Candidatus Daviesbacteria bacterium]|nr:SGNH/GDSL hydrolase family protein [Candidatus Daviesbacteria bacterium]
MIFRNRKTQIFVVFAFIIYAFNAVLILSNPQILENIERSLPQPIYLGRLAYSKLNNSQPPIKPAGSHTILLIGDSMTDFLRGNEGILKTHLDPFYPNKKINILNYGFGSSNILSVSDRLTKDTSYMGTNFPSILSQNFDLIIVESFGNNPLSEYSMEEGLKKNNEKLDEIVKTIKQSKPQVYIVFLATIAPTKAKFGEGVVKLSQEERFKWGLEREKYIENHIKYAKSHNIPVIDIYHATKNKNNDGDINFLRKDDFIHPSAEGVQKIYREMAQFIVQNRILPF